MLEYSKLQEINEKLQTIDIKGKDYVEVNSRILGFRKLFENGSIETELIQLENGICTFKAIVKNDDGKIIATGYAQEKESSSFINKTSYIENCETSAVGRALGMLGIGATKSIASAEEVINAINNQQTEQDEIDITKMVGFGKYKDKTWIEVYSENPKYFDWLIENAKSEQGAETYKKIKQEIENSHITISDEEYEQIIK